MVNDLGPQSLQLRQMVAARLRAEILEGILMPGEWLRQEALSRRHGVSQTPVREALKQLAAEGLVEDVPYRGVRVVALRSEDVEDLYSCRAVIESRAARFAAANITDDEIEELEELYQQMVRCPVPERLGEYRELNRQFPRRDHRCEPSFVPGSQSGPTLVRVSVDALEPSAAGRRRIRTRP